MNQTGNRNKRNLGFVGVFVFVATVLAVFQNCGSAVKTGEVPTQTVLNVPTPTPGTSPTPTPSTPPGVGSFSASNTGTAPTARCQHTSVTAGGQYFVWGGVNPSVSMPTDGGLLNPITNMWSPVSASNAPGPRSFATAVYTGTSVIVWGGSYTSNLNTGGIYNIGTGVWTTMGTLGAPAGRYNNAAVWTGTKMIVYGGAILTGTAETFVNTGGIYDPATNTWAPMTSGPLTAGITSGAWTGSKFVVFGGAHGNQGGIYDPVTNTWAALPALNLPAARDAHGVFWNGSRVVVWGGYSLGGDGKNYFNNTGAMFDVAAGTWTAMSVVGAPIGGIDRSFGWNSSRLFVYEPQLTAGGIFDSTANTWAPMNVNGGMGPRFSQTTGLVGNALITWGGCTQTNGISTGFNTGTIYQ